MSALDQILGSRAEKKSRVLGDKKMQIAKKYQRGYTSHGHYRDLEGKKSSPSGQNHDFDRRTKDKLIKE